MAKYVLLILSVFLISACNESRDESSTQFKGQSAIRLARQHGINLEKTDPKGAEFGIMMGPHCSEAAYQSFLKRAAKNTELQNALICAKQNGVLVLVNSWEHMFNKFHVYRGMNTISIHVSASDQTIIKFLLDE